MSTISFCFRKYLNPPQFIFYPLVMGLGYKVVGYVEVDVDRLKIDWERLNNKL